MKFLFPILATFTVFTVNANAVDAYSKAKHRGLFTASRRVTSRSIQLSGHDLRVAITKP